MSNEQRNEAPPGFAELVRTGGVEQEQVRLASLAPPLWIPGTDAIMAAGVFVAFSRGRTGPGQAGDHAFVGAAATRGIEPGAQVVVERRAGAPYRPGYLAEREGAMIVDALRHLMTVAGRPDVVLVDATGRDHPRRAGMALHVGAVLGVPSIGVTHRPLRASGPEPDDIVGATTELRLDDELVGHWVRVQRGVRPLAVHAGWRTDADTAVEVVLRVTAEARTPEPLRLARAAARVARAEAELRPAMGPGRGEAVR